MRNNSTTLSAVKLKYPTLMRDIRDLLHSQKIKCETSQSEIVAVNTPEADVLSVVSNLICANDRKLLLDVIGVRGNTYIRYKV